MKIVHQANAAGVGEKFAIYSSLSMTVTLILAIAKSHCPKFNATFFLQIPSGIYNTLLRKVHHCPDVVYVTAASRRRRIIQTCQYAF